MLRVLIFNLFFLISLISAKQPGGCPNITGLPMDPRRAAGIWYLHSRSGNFSDTAIKCGRIIFDTPDGFNFTLIFRSISRITNEISSIVVEGNAKSPTFRHHVPVLGEVDIDNIILGHDYDRWTVLYHCDSVGNTPNENVWVLTRDQFPNEMRLNQFIDQSYRYWGLKKPEFRKVPQNCQF